MNNIYSSLQALDGICKQEKKERDSLRDFYNQRDLKKAMDDSGKFIDMGTFQLKIQEAIITDYDVVPDTYRINALGEVHKIRKNGLNYPKTLSVHNFGNLNIGGYGAWNWNIVSFPSFGYVEFNSASKVDKNKKPLKIRESLPFLVARYFVANPDPYYFRAIKFKDGNINNYRADNLIWSAQFDLNTLPEYDKRCRMERVMEKVRRGTSGNSTDILIDYYSVNGLYMPDDIVANTLNIDKAMIKDFKLNNPYINII